VPGYRTWKDQVADGHQIVGPSGEFAWGWLDSVEVGANIYRNKFRSYFREDDDDYRPGPPPVPEVNPENEILRDGILTPGSKIEYFVTANYTCTPSERYLYPDTSGGTFWEFEILPGYRTEEDTGFYRFPCFLYVDAFDRGVQRLIEGSLNVVLGGVELPSAFDIPDPAPWDRYDYDGAASCCRAPLFRAPGGTNGATVTQLLGYRMILVNTGVFAEGTLMPEDWSGFDSWLTSSTCGANGWTQGFWASGEGIAEGIEYASPTFLSDRCGAGVVCTAYNLDTCPSPDPDNNEEYCAGLNAPAGAVWEPPADLDLWGNWCPQQFGFTVLDATGSGIGNKQYRKLSSGALTDFAQVVNDQSASAYNYRTVVDGYSLHQLVRADPGQNPECLPDPSGLDLVEAMAGEVDQVLRYTLGLSQPLDLGLCEDPCLDPADAPEEMAETALPVNRLEQNRPNPFSPGTTIRFSLARTGPARLLIYDGNGRRVRSLLDGPLTAGPHLAVWDGLDDAHNRLASGVYWCELSTEGYSSHKKMIILR